MVCIPIVAYIILFRNHVTSRDVGNVKGKVKSPKAFPNGSSVLCFTKRYVYLFLEF